MLNAIIGFSSIFFKELYSSLKNFDKSTGDTSSEVEQTAFDELPDIIDINAVFNAAILVIQTPANEYISIG